jgi:hypothetical protein
MPDKPIKVQDVVSAVLENKSVPSEVQAVGVIREELLRMIVREELTKAKSASGDAWKMKMSKIIESGCLLNGD